MSELKGLYAIWFREVKVFLREKSRWISSLLTPVMWLILFGGGLSTSVQIGNYSYENFIFPGIVAMVILFTSVFYGSYIVWDKRLDFLKEVLVSPISRTTIFLGKVLGGVVISMAEGIIILLFGLLLGISYSAVQFILSVSFMLIFAIVMVSLGITIGSQMESPEGFGLIISFVMFPMFFLSGALYPLDNLPQIARIVTYINPVTYAVDALRGILLGKTLFGYIIDVGAILAYCALLLFVGTLGFKRMKL